MPFLAFSIGADIGGIPMPLLKFFKKKIFFFFFFENLAQAIFYFIFKKTLLWIIYKENIYNINFIVIHSYNLYF
jgi:hypothetical protein